MNWIDLCLCQCFLPFDLECIDEQELEWILEALLLEV